ncbi:hypothetical protein CDL15_Pgr004358 [Punica granatum]|uniref:Uncharacterized protein n=1 Tax=Punica granatum TaxID=22663 RepID=A0A218XG34_PUNGR|nr:hypothetical protein CDL15_Pgr004358 [Punica granatum]
MRPTIEARRYNQPEFMAQPGPDSGEWVGGARMEIPKERKNAFGTSSKDALHILGTYYHYMQGNFITAKLEEERLTYILRGFQGREHPWT